MRPLWLLPRSGSSPTCHDATCARSPGTSGTHPEMLRRPASHVEATAFIWRALVTRLDDAGVRTWGDLKAWLEGPAPSSRARRAKRGDPPATPLPRSARCAGLLERSAGDAGDAGGGARGSDEAVRATALGVGVAFARRMQSLASVATRRPPCRRGSRDAARRLRRQGANRGRPLTPGRADAHVRRRAERILATSSIR